MLHSGITQEKTVCPILSTLSKCPVILFGGQMDKMNDSHHYSHLAATSVTCVSLIVEIAVQARDDDDEVIPCKYPEYCMNLNCIIFLYKTYYYENYT